MKLIYISRPPMWERLPDGHVRVHYNVTETDEAIFKREGKSRVKNGTRKVYQCDSVVIDGKPTVSAVVSAILRQKYSQDDEFAILRQRDVKPEEFATYFADAEAAKVIAHGLLDELSD